MKIIIFLLITILSIIGFNNSFCQSPVNDFTYDIRKVNCDYYIADFYYNSLSAGDVDSCCWDFGDGMVICRSHTNSASHNYSKPGTFSVTLTLWKDGIESTITKNDLVKVFIPPTPDFEMIFSDSNLYAPLGVVFQNSTQLGDCAEVNYSWDFGDGNTTQVESPEHIFNYPNTYNVSLNVSDTFGCEKEYLACVIVKDTAQKGEFEHIICNCSTNICDYGKNHMIEESPYIINELMERNDTIVFSGIMLQNCCTNRTATLRQKNDTIFIQTWESGPQCTCWDDFYFEIELPQINEDTFIISFNNFVVKTTITDINKRHYKSIIYVYPNPVSDLLRIELPVDFTTELQYHIVDIRGEIIQKGLLKNQNPIRLNFNNKGQFILYLYDNRARINYVAKFIKI